MPRSGNTFLSSVRSRCFIAFSATWPQSRALLCFLHLLPWTTLSFLQTCYHPVKLIKHLQSERPTGLEERRLSVQRRDTLSEDGFLTAANHKQVPGPRRRGSFCGANMKIGIQGLKNKAKRTKFRSFVSHDGFVCSSGELSARWLRRETDQDGERVGKHATTSLRYVRSADRIQPNTL